MTDKELQAIAARTEAATRGPWEVDTETGEIIAQGNVVLGTIYGVEDYPCLEEDISDECQANAAFIAHARTDIPALLAEIASLRARLARTAVECSYCGAVLSAADTQAQANHWRDCPQHPARAELEEYRHAVDTLTEALRVKEAEIIRLTAENESQQNTINDLYNFRDS